MNQINKEQLNQILADFKKYLDGKFAELKASGISLGNNSANPYPTPPNSAPSSPTISLTTGAGAIPSIDLTPPLSPKPKTSQELENEKWEQFFAKKGVATGKDPWKASGLNPTEAEITFNNGWQDATIIKGKVIPNYSSEGQTNTNLNPLSDNKANIDKNNKERAKLQAEWEAFYTKHVIVPAEQTQWGVYNKPTEAEKVYTDALGQGLDEEEKKIVNQAKTPKSIEQALKQDIPWKRFFKDKGISEQGKKDWPITGLTPEEAQKAWNNGWKNAKYKIKNRLVDNYAYDFAKDSKVILDNKNIDVLTVDQDELNRSCHFFTSIHNATSFTDLDAISKVKIEELKDGLLTLSRKKADVLKALQEKSDTMRYKLDEPKDGGLTKEELSKSQAIITNLKPVHKFAGTAGTPHPQSGYGIWTVDIVNEFLNVSDLKLTEVDEDGNVKTNPKGIPITTPFKVSGNTIENLDVPSPEYGGKSWLESQKAFKLPKEITDKEDKLSVKAKGMYLLPYFHKLNNYDPKNPSFRKWEWVTKTTKEGKEIKVKDIPVHPKGHPEEGSPVDKSGMKAKATGVGKTTKDMNDLIGNDWFEEDGKLDENGKEKEKRNVVLVCPNLILCASAAGHHGGFLQTWGCVICQVSKKDANGNSIFEELFNPITGQVEKESVFKSHGSYDVKLNDLCYWEDDEGKLQGKKGLSVLEESTLFTYLVRKIWNTEKTKEGINKGKTGRQIVEERIKIFTSKQQEEKANYEKYLKEAVSKFIPKGTIVVFDEADEATPEWKTIIKQTIFLAKEAGLEVQEMSATFKGIPFSSTSSFPRANLYMSSLQPNFTHEGKEYDLNEVLKNDKFGVFLPNVERGFNEKQIEILKKYDLAHVLCGSPFSNALESITFGMPPSTTFFFSKEHGRGLSPDIGLIILTNIMETSNLQTNWKYSASIYSPNTLPAYAQEIGRTGRGRTAKGKEGQELDIAVSITVNKKLEETVIKPDVAVYVIQAGLSADANALLRLKDSISDINHLRGSIALATEENKKWGLYPAELIVGTGDGSAGYPKWGRAKTSFSPDETLWKKHLGIYEPPKLEPAVAKDIMDLMIATYIKQPKSANDKQGANNFPYQVNVEMKSTLISDYGLEPEQVKQVLNGVIDQRLKEISEKKIEKIDAKIFKYEEKLLFQEAVALCKLALGTEAKKNILVREEEDKDKKKFWVMRINYKIV